MLVDVVMVGSFCLVSGVIAGLLTGGQVYRRRFAESWLDTGEERS